VWVLVLQATLVLLGLRHLFDPHTILDLQQEAKERAKVRHRFFNE
jgi:hypothetical protein